MAEPVDALTVAGRLALAQRAGGVVGPVLTAVFALLIGGLVVLVALMPALAHAQLGVPWTRQSASTTPRRGSAAMRVVPIWW